MKFKKQKFNSFITGGVFLLLSCTQPPIVLPSQNGQNPYNYQQPGQNQNLPPGYRPPGTNIDPPPRNNDDDDRTTRRPNPRRRRPVIRRPTRQRDRGVCFTEFGGDRCDEDDDCWSLCHQIFHRRSEQDNCGRRPDELVDAFDLLLEDMQTGNVESIDGMVMQCLFQIDDGEFMKHLNRLNNRRAKAFLREIGYKEDLAQAIFELDEEHRIMRDLLEEAGFDEGWDFLTEEVDSRDTLIEVILEEENEDAWLWLDNYVRDRCARTSTNYCESRLDTIYYKAGGNDAAKGLGEEEKREAFAAYCNALKDSNNDYESFVDSEIFESDYEDFVVDLHVCCKEEDKDRLDREDCVLRYDDNGAHKRTVCGKPDSGLRTCDGDSDCGGGANSCADPVNEVRYCKNTQVSGDGKYPHQFRLPWTEGGLKEACRIVLNTSGN